jgi:MoxR-like ATPase
MNQRDLPHVRLEQVLFEMRRVIVGQDRVLERLMVAVLADGHVLLEGVPGLGKTLALETIPSDIIGTRIYRPSQEAFDIEPGPVFANIVLADEINRAPAKVQSALLEVMAERHVTIGGRTLQAPSPFLVVATQNPIESEGVYALPEAQRDRFLMRVPVDYPTPAEEAEIVRRMENGVPAVSRLLDATDVVALQAAARGVYVDPVVADYGVRIVLATREPAAHGVTDIAGQLEYGASPRASIGLVRAGRAMALLRGRDYVLPQDIYDVAYDILNHRLVLSYRALAEGITTDEIVVKVLSTVRAPRLATVGPDGRTAWQLAPGVTPATQLPVQAPQPTWQAPEPAAAQWAPPVLAQPYPAQQAAQQPPVQPQPPVQAQPYPAQQAAQQPPVQPQPQPVQQPALQPQPVQQPVQQLVQQPVPQPQPASWQTAPAGAAAPAPQQPAATYVTPSRHSEAATAAPDREGTDGPGAR